MAAIKNIMTLSGAIEEIFVETPDGKEIDAKGKLTLLPALIDPHVYFYAPENWAGGSKAALSGGITTVFEMPNRSFPCSTLRELSEKKNSINRELAKAEIPLNYKLYLGSDSDHDEEIGIAKNQAVGLCIHMSRINNAETLDRIFQLAAQHNIIISIHAEDSIKAMEQALSLLEKYSSQVFFMSVGTKEELDLIRMAKKKQLLVFAETTPRQLFLLKEEREAIWEGIHDGAIDAIGSGHSPIEGPAIEAMLPLLLHAVNEKKLTLEQVVHLTRINLEFIYNLERNRDLVLVDMNLNKEVSNTLPYAGRLLKGRPVYTILKGKVYTA